MGGPIAFYMWNDTLATAMETGIILYADTHTGGIEIMKRVRQRGQIWGPRLIVTRFLGWWR